ncbi:Metallo-dependent hydrolase [Auriculariales sp. MPI-PUGE-AT-0066]|nr:Metallo-dependent hydrolase [Auriculariales sp. MPI-PUGE-AT-0066]
MPQRIIGTFVHTPNLGTLEILHHYSLLIDDEGVIADIQALDTDRTLSGESSDVPSLILPHGTFICPAFVDGHLHAPQFMFLGNGLDLPLMQWLYEYAYKAEVQIDEDQALARLVYSRLAQRLIENGTSTALLFGTIKTQSNLILAEEFQKAGLRGLVGKLSMNESLLPTYVEATTTESLAAAREFIDSCHALTADLPQHRRLCEPVITPRFVPTCTDDLLDGLGKLAQETGVRIQSHMAEAHDQIAWVRATRKREDIDIFDQYNLLTSRTIQAHCTFLTSADLRRMVERGSALTHCPLSNAYFSAEQLPLREALAAGVQVALGSDCAGGYDLDIMRQMRHAVATSRIREGQRVVNQERKKVQPEPNADAAAQPASIDWKEALYLATRGGALALGLGQCGSFKVGHAFDAQQIKVFDEATLLGEGALDFFLPPPAKLDEASVEKWWCLGDHRNREAMWVQGQRLGKQVPDDSVPAAAP